MSDSEKRIAELKAMLELAQRKTSKEKAKDAGAKAQKTKKLRKLSDPNYREYPEPKQHDLTEREKEQIRARVQEGELDSFKLAEEFHCTSSQVAGIIAAMHRR